jgi:hypothetical protein
MFTRGLLLISVALIGSDAALTGPATDRSLFFAFVLLAGVFQTTYGILSAVARLDAAARGLTQTAPAPPAP